MTQILIVDDEADIRNLISDILIDEGYSVLTAGNASDALNIAQTESIDLVVLDIWLEGCEFDGIGVLKRLKFSNANLPVIMISGHGNIETAIQTIKLGAYDFIEKPFKVEKMLIMIKRALEHSNLSKENLRLKNSVHMFSQIEGSSKATKAVTEQVKLIAPTNSRVMIVGESGTGKTVLARMIHNMSLRSKFPFIILHAANLSEKQFEEDLFGIDEGGKFKVGLLEQANGGTLFIKEISGMTLKLQNKFLKVIQENQLQRLGSNKLVPLDIRIITSTSKNLENEIKEGRFNQSLYYRLCVTPISIAKLKDRNDDIVNIFNALNEHYADQYSLSMLKLSEKTMAAIQMYDWPGNVRQLKNMVEWLLIMHGKQNSEIEISELPQEICNTASAQNGNFNEMIMLPLRAARNNFEKEYLEAQLNRFSGNISKTAEYVGMERTALHRKLRSLKIVE